MCNVHACDSHLSRTCFLTHPFLAVKKNCCLVFCCFGQKYVPYLSEQVYQFGLCRLVCCCCYMVIRRTWCQRRSKQCASRLYYKHCHDCLATLGVVLYNFFASIAPFTQILCYIAWLTIRGPFTWLILLFRWPVNSKRGTIYSNSTLH